ncbi:PH domain-containing protein [Vibrio cholerae]|nr:PH domain-containing protein [Vibrio cholerae]EKF9853934.1 PH domain-containing protein [Vibrio cholerae]
MSYIQQNLTKDEVIVSEMKAHRTAYVSFFIYGILGIVCLPITIFFIILGLNLYFTEYSITNKRIVCKTGYFSTVTEEAQLKQIESMTIRIGVFERIFGVGSVVINLTGGKSLILQSIENPELAKKNIIDLIDGF